MNETKINTVKIDPVVVPSKDEAKRKGYDIFPAVKQWICYICARKGSGKTSLINSIIEKTTNKKTTIYLFVSTYKVDPTWIKIIEDLTDKGYTIHAFDSIFEGRGKAGINNLEPIVKELNSGQAETSLQSTPNLIEKPAAKKQHLMDRFGLPCKPINLFGEGEPAPAPYTLNEQLISKPQPERKKKKSKSNASANLFIFDDIANQLQNPAVTALLKIHRHSDSNVIVSSQSLNDLALSALYQINFFIAFKGLSEAKLEECWRKLDISIPFDIYLAAYKHATAEKYDFFYLNTRTDELRRNFNFLLTNKNANSE